ncbi:formimidoylglutamase [Parapedobacter deserti]|uniref:Formimidoylglutamase n=1 Tax=Parapedobacter deserti TaxID=1912957 RepID=A0ABV7JP42_9SPHI
MEKRDPLPINIKFYHAPDMQCWKGRIDGTAETELRWHQHVQPLNLVAPFKQSLEGCVILLGFPCDEGVKRNGGRTGAAQGPAALRDALCNLPVFYPDLSIYDAGDIVCRENDLKTAQVQLAAAVKRICEHGAFPLVLGGGHEVTYGHYRGIAESIRHESGARRVGTVNFDAHFDNREPKGSEPNSGTGFWQIAKDCKEENHPFHYLALGIQKTSNTPSLFNTAHQTGTQYVLAEHFTKDDQHIPQGLIAAFIEAVDSIYLTIDLDVFAAAYAPGVSAPAYSGILPDRVFFECLDSLFNSGKVVSMDIAELNPDFDIDNRTARLAASLIFHVIARLADRH